MKQGLFRAVTVAGCFLWLLVLIGLVRPAPGPADYSRFKAAVVRLNIVGTDKTFCSGVVISDSTILTAAHCGAGAMPPYGLIEIRTADNLAGHGVLAQLAGSSGLSDLAILHGDFSKLPKLSMAEGSQSIMDRYLDNTRTTIVCGYPWGNDLVCNEVHGKRFAYIGGFMNFIAQGWMLPGMSGGPVIDVETGTVLGTNHGVSEQGVFMSPAAGLAKLMGIPDSQL